MSDQVQRDRAIDPTASCCVVAPAGSGKTSLLVQRMLALLARVSHPEQIVAITFTRKAAAEMRARMAEVFELAQVKQLSEVPEYERVSLELAKHALSNASERGWSLPEQLERLQFMTIDSFCASLVRQMPLASRMGGVMTPAEPVADLYRAAVLDLLQSSEPQIREHLPPILAALGNRWESAIEWLSELLAKRDQWQLALFPGQREQDALDYMRETWELECQRRVAQLNADLAPWRAQLQEILNLLGLEETSDFLPLHSPSAIGSWRRVARFLLTQGGEWRKSVTVKEGFPPKSEQKELHSVVSAEIRAALSPIVFEGVALMPEALDDDQNWQIVTSIVAILPHLLASFWWQCQQRGEVDFTQIASAALEALGDDEDPTDLALKLDYSIQHLLVDEFQDTSTHQFELIRRLTRGWFEHNQITPESPKTLFVVGDAMQSIYRFRGAQVDLFVRAIEEGFNGLRLERLDLCRNFRSSEGIVQWVNQVFADLPSHSSPMIKRLAANRAEPVLGGETEIQLHAFAADPNAARETEFVVERVRSWLEADASTTIAVLGRTRSQLAPIMKSLKDAGIAYNAADVERIADNVAVADFVNVLRVIVDPSDTLASMACLRAPWIGASLEVLHQAQTIHARLDTGDWHASLHALEQDSEDPELQGCLARLNAVIRWGFVFRGRRAVRLWLETLWEGLAGFSIYSSDRDHVAIDTLFEVLEQNPWTIDSPWEITELLESKTITSQRSSRVSVMTMHKSKGLEFDHVVLPSMGRGSRSSSRQLFEWAELPVPHSYGFLLGCSKGAETAGLSIGNWLHEREKIALNDELKRLFYVAATRAKRTLYITTSYKQQDPERCRPAKGSLLGQVTQLSSHECSWHVIPEASEEISGAGSNLSPMRIARFVPATIDALPDSCLTGVEHDLVVAQDWLESSAVQGSLVHKAFELAIRAGQLPRCDVYLRGRLFHEAVSLGYPAAKADECVEQALSVIQVTAGNPSAHWLFVGDQWQRYPEYSVSRRVADGFESYYIDLLLRSTSDDRLRIVDYKTNMPDPSETPQDFERRMLETYQAQMNIYVAIISKMEGRSPEAFLFLTHTQRLVQFDATTLRETT